MKEWTILPITEKSRQKKEGREKFVLRKNKCCLSFKVMEIDFQLHLKGKVWETRSNKFQNWGISGPPLTKRGSRFFQDTR